MKLKHIVLVFVSVFLFFSQVDIKAYSNELYNTDSMNERDLIYYYNHISSSEWNKYFRKQAKKIKRHWKNNKVLFSPEYETSYVRVLIKLNKYGEIISYDIKSSCVPYNNSEFTKHIKSTINNIGYFEPLPQNYGYDYAVFTIKFHSELPQKINKSNIDWNKYGIADIEVDKKSAEVVIRR